MVGPSRGRDGSAGVDSEHSPAFASLPPKGVCLVLWCCWFPWLGRQGAGTEVLGSIVNIPQPLLVCPQKVCVLCCFLCCCWFVLWAVAVRILPSCEPRRVGGERAERGRSWRREQ